MKKNAARLNRVWLTVTGLALLVAGGLGLLAGLDQLHVLTGAVGLGPGPAPDAAVVPRAVGGFTGSAAGPVAVGLAGLLLAVLGLLWLLRQVPRTRAAKPFRLHDDAVAGLTVCDPAVLGAAVEAEVTALPGVSRASAVLRGTVARPDLTLKVTADERSAVQPLLRSLQGDVADHLATALGTPLHRLGVLVEVGRDRRSSDRVTF
ncbi:hypothetical protein SAMN04488543_2652 [Friedmanniella luteola]|uniref:Alkaline shock response membrane anchor protein AmaP n=1 Tax=Friedmanniella luteola TaxID=546871 RepID=A0A1H1W5T4_9ACTN|nr:hypothetical protein [Friedmanniella luteola]SDS92404.1 hypothetical protein SAMN04488543_2652 [Friedmanniella luteola]